MLSYGQVTQALGPLLREARPGGRGRFRTVSNDSRTLRPGDLFFALKTEQRDGHDFLGHAIEGGAAGAVVQREDVEVPAGVALFRVADTQRALGELAGWWRSRRQVKVIGVAGNVGKTTTKEIAAAVLGARYGVLKSPANFNDEAGISMSLFGLKPRHQRAVLEMAMYSLGEIRRLCEIARPEVGVITNVGPTHLERLGSMEALANAKAELVESLPPHGAAILNGDDPIVRGMSARTRAHTVLFGTGPGCEVRGRLVGSRGLEGIGFVLEYQGAEAQVSAPLPGRHLLHNALAAAAVGLVDGMSLQEVAQALAKARVPLRLQVYRGRQGATILDDSYNASPASMLAALDLLGEVPGRRIAVLGDMRELGPEEERGHRVVGQRAAEVAEVIHAVGQLGRIIGETARQAGHPCVALWDSKEEAAREVAGSLEPGDVVLLKASRALALETVLPILRDKA